MAPEAGFEPATNGLTVRCATAAPFGSNSVGAHYRVFDLRVNAFVKICLHQGFGQATHRLFKLRHGCGIGQAHMPWRAKRRAGYDGNACVVEQLV